MRILKNLRHACPFRVRPILHHGHVPCRQMIHEYREVQPFWFQPKPNTGISSGIEIEDYQLSAFSEVGLKPDDSISPMFRILRAST